MSGTIPTFLAQATAPELADIRDPVTFYSWLFVGLVALGILVAVAVLWFILQRRKRAAAAAEAGPPPVAPEVWAREELDRLERDNPSLDDKQFTSGAADILRTYLERAFHVPAPERTTEEFLALIGEHAAFQGALQTALNTFLTRSDLVKFARQAIAPEMRQAMLGEARSVIDEATTVQARLAAQAAVPTPAEIAS